MLHSPQNVGEGKEKEKIPHLKRPSQREQNTICLTSKEKYVLWNRAFVRALEVNTVSSVLYTGAA